MQAQTIVTLIMQYKITELFSQTACHPCFPPSEQWYLHFGVSKNTEWV